VIRLAVALALGAVHAAALPCDTGKYAPEARPFGNPDAASADVGAALVRARTTGHRVILVFGANWCHDSRALAGWFGTWSFVEMMRDRYEIVWINVGDEPGEKDKNADLARRFGLDGIQGTPTVLVLDATGKPLNLADAPTWRNAASRKEDAIFAYFQRMAG